MPYRREAAMLAEDSHKPLRDDVRLLGELLGETLIRQEGEDLYQRVERVRGCAKRARRRAGEGDGEPFCDIVEMIQAESWEAWQAVNEQPEMKEAVEQFFAIAKRGSVQVLYGNKIEP